MYLVQIWKRLKRRLNIVVENKIIYGSFLVIVKISRKNHTSLLRKQSILGFEGVSFKENFMKQTLQSLPHIIAIEADIAMFSS